MAEAKLNPADFRRRFVNDRFVDIIAVHPGRKFKADYEVEIRGSLLGPPKLSHYEIDSDYRRSETPEWVYALFGLKR